MKPRMSVFESLPAELITHILEFLTPISLAGLSRTSRLLRSQAYNDLLWMSFVKDALRTSTRIETPTPAKSWRDLYISHHPYWFLLQNKIWFADSPNTGLLILTRYNRKEGRIEGYRLLAEHGAHTFENWAYNPEVIIHTFNPKVKLWFDDPVINLGFELDNKNRLRGEVAMQTGTTHGICSMISLCQPIPNSLQDPRMALWPPAIIPAHQRVRNESSNKFRTETHRPHSQALISDQTFRLRKWLQFSNLMLPLSSVRVGEEVMTFSSLLEESYTPTKAKPWQGIWIGDYSGHGCEFLLVLQREVAAPMALSRRSSTGSLPPGVSLTRNEHDLTQMPEDQTSDLGDKMDRGNAADLTEIGDQSSDGADSWREGSHNFGSNVGGDPESKDASTEPATNGTDTGDSSMGSTYLGRLEAIKLTGDINVPRGEFTWIAEDIGPNGLLRVANEQMFVGARTVKSWGRIAGRGFQHNRFIPTQLIMISHDTLAQYWEVSSLLRISRVDHR